jgi:hypothetical protein
MDLVVIGIIAGILGTIAMDLLNYLLARMGLILRIDVRMIGRMSAGWFRGRFRYHNPAEMVQVANELLLGYLTHYAIGVGLAIPFVFAWSHLFGKPLSPEWILTYGVATTVASVLVVYPSMGLGVFGMRSPEGIRAPLSSLANHFFFGAGMAFSIAVT